MSRGRRYGEGAGQVIKVLSPKWFLLSDLGRLGRGLIVLTEVCQGNCTTRSEIGYPCSNFQVTRELACEWHKNGQPLFVGSQSRGRLAGVALQGANMEVGSASISLVLDHFRVSGDELFLDL